MTFSIRALLEHDAEQRDRGTGAGRALIGGLPTALVAYFHQPRRCADNARLKTALPEPRTEQQAGRPQSDRAQTGQW